MSQTSSLVLLASPRTKHHVTEARVVVMMIDVDDAAVPRRERERQTLEAAAVEGVQRTARRRQAARDGAERQQILLEGQDLVLVDVQSSLHPELREEVEHAGGGAERVRVGSFVHRQGDAALGLHAPAHGGQVGGQRLHAGPSSPSSALASLSPSPSSVSPSTKISGASLPSTSSSRFMSFSMCKALSSVLS